MDKVAKIYMGEWKSSTKKTPEFISFARKFKNALKKELESIGAEITKYNVGHFYISGFFRLDGKCYYFSLPDVRWKTGGDMMLYRTAKDENHYTGGMNRYVGVATGMGKKMKLN